MKKKMLLLPLVLLLAISLTLMGCPPPVVDPVDPVDPVVPVDPAVPPGFAYVIGFGGYRTGPFMHTGAVAGDGAQDMATLYRLRGGIDGWPVELLEIETGYETPRIIEAYERAKAEAPGRLMAFHPLSTGGVLGILARTYVDKIPVIQTGYGVSAAAYGRAFPFIFSVTPTYWGIEATTVSWIAEQEGGEAELRGLRIGMVYLDIDYGRETIPLMKELERRFGFELVLYPIPWPGLEQTALWTRIAAERPDWLIWRLWGMSTPTALTEAFRVGFPMRRWIGSPWSGTEADTAITGPDRVVGIRLNSWSAAGTDFPAIQEILTRVHDAGLGYGPRARVGTHLYNRGVFIMAVSVAAIRIAAEEFGHPVTSEQVAWGLRHITPEALAREGIAGIAPPIRTSPEDHAGTYLSKMHEWDGTRFVPITPWFSAYEDIVRGMIVDAGRAFMAARPELFR